MNNNLVRLTSEAELQSIQKETIINKTTKVTKVSDNSVLAGIAAGNAKIGKKALKDIALAVSHLFPDTASGSVLDVVASNHGIAARLGASQSSTYIRLVADAGTVYTQGVHTFAGANGIKFDLDAASVTIGSKGFEYVKVRSQNTGAINNVDPYVINTVSPIPSGHIGVLNEYAATGGRDVESDVMFRQRIKEGQNLLGLKTLAYLEQAFMKINANVLRVFFEGVDQNGKVVLAILTQNGVDLSTNELNTLLSQGKDYFAITELAPVGYPAEATGITLKNVTYHNVDVDFRFELFDAGLLAETVKSIQIQFSKAVDFRVWNPTKDYVDWAVLLTIVKNTPNVKYVPDRYFTPNADIVVANNSVPRFRGFIARDLTGSILLNQAGTIDPIFYPNDPLISLQVSVL